MIIEFCNKMITTVENNTNLLMFENSKKNN